MTLRREQFAALRFLSCSPVCRLSKKLLDTSSTARFGMSGRLLMEVSVIKDIKLV